MSSFILFVFFLCVSDSESMKALKNVAVKSGGSLSIPCVYDQKYQVNRKYWCKGEYWISCTAVAYTNTTSERTSVTDHPAQNMFTVELKSLRDSDSGYYWCAVEICDKWTLDKKEYLYLTVSADPAVWVTNSRVSGQEGGSVSVQCFYRSKYKNKQKKWCRYKDWSCYEVGRTNTSQNSAVLVTDYGKGSSRVEMRGLQKSDAGWYWFSAGDVEVTVHLTVTERPSTVTTVKTTDKKSTMETTLGSTIVTRNAETIIKGKTMPVWVLSTLGLGILLILIIILTCRLKKKCNEKSEARERRGDTAVHTTSAEEQVTYVTVVRKEKTTSPVLEYENVKVHHSVAAAMKRKTPSPGVKDDEVIYSSVACK